MDLKTRGPDLDQTFPRRSHCKGAERASCRTLKSRASSAVLQQLFVFLQFNTFCSLSTVLLILLNIFATTHFTIISAQRSTLTVSPLQAVANFSILSNSYDCTATGNVICLGQAHPYEGDLSSDIEPGRLSLLKNNSNNAIGLAYYKQPVKLLDLSSNQAASFNTSFTIDMRQYQRQDGDGMTFLISANSSYMASDAIGGSLGIFDPKLYSVPFRNIVVEFDTFRNNLPPINDINGNHVSFDFRNITGLSPVDANQVNVSLADENTKYAWVEYSSATQLLEVRVSYINIRPVKPLSNITVNLLDFVEENMWVGFSSASGSFFSNFYIGDWTFESYGIAAPPPVPAVAPAAPAPSPAPTLSRAAPTPLISIPVPVAPVPAAATGGKSSGGTPLGTVVGISVGGVIFFLVCVSVIALFVRRRRSGSRGKLGGLVGTEDAAMQLEGMPERFSYKHLSVATKAFSEEMKLGQGGFGSVYRGVLPSSGIAVAVKKINSDSNQGEKEFMAEVSIISQLRHRNLIQLHGWCKDAAREKYLLVYELMPNGSLDKVLFQPGLAGGSTPSASLSWAQRLNVVTGTAAALDYLHQGWKQQVIHRDIKSSNIMLDHEWNAKLGDFGLARLVDHQRAATTTIVAGTYGYIAPEAASTGRFTDKTDVFAFGAVVLEIACGRSAFSLDFPPVEYFLVDWVWNNLSDGTLLNTVDERLTDYDTYWIQVLLVIGLWCSHPNPLARPSMRHVVQVLAGDAPVPSIPASKPAAVFSSDRPNVSIDSLLRRKSTSRGSTSDKSKSGSIEMGDL